MTRFLKAWFKNFIGFLKACCQLLLLVIIAFGIYIGLCELLLEVLPAALAFTMSGVIMLILIGITYTTKLDME